MSLVRLEPSASRSYKDTLPPNHRISLSNNEQGNRSNHVLEDSYVGKSVLTCVYMLQSSWAKLLIICLSLYPVFILYVLPAAHALWQDCVDCWPN